MKQKKRVTIVFDLETDHEHILAPLDSKNMVQDLVYRNMREFSRDVAKTNGFNAYYISEKLVTAFVCNM